MIQQTLFISYSYKDEAEKKELVTQLSVLQQQGLIDAWTDDRISPGADWAKELRQAIDRAKVAILLITANYLGSDALQSQTKRLRDRHEAGQLILIPIIARPCVWQVVPWLKKIVPPNQKPVWRDGGRYVDQELSAIAGEIAQLMVGPEQIYDPKSQVASAAEVTSYSPANSRREVGGVSAGSEGGAAKSQTLSSTPAPLQDALKRGNLTLFIGADLPSSVTGLPSRVDLAFDLAQQHGIDEKLPLAEVAQRVSQAGNRWTFTDFIRNALDTTGKSPQFFQQQVVTLVKKHRLESIITTAYDNLLELAFQSAGLGLNRVIRGNDVNFINPDRATLVKLYGDAQQPETLIVTDQDHNKMLRDQEREAIIDEVRQALRRSTVLFVGYNLADSDFRFLFDQVTESRFRRTAYAVWPGLPDVEKQMWRDRGITILEVAPFGLLSNLSGPAPADNKQSEVQIQEITSPKGEGNMDYQQGLSQLKNCVEQDNEALLEFSTLSARFDKNQKNERLFGSSENTRNDHSQIMYALNDLALKHCNRSFNDLCQGEQTITQAGIKADAGQNDEAKSKQHSIDFAIITALPKEAQAVVTRLENYEIKRFEDKDIRTYHCGTVPIKGGDGFYRVAVVVLPSMGNVSAANTATDTIAHWNPRFVLMVGIAAGIPENEVKLGDVVVANQIVGYDYGKVTSKGIKRRDRVYPGSALLLDRINNFWDKSWTKQIDEPRPENASQAVSKVLVGPVAAGNKVIASKKFREQLIKHWSKLLGLEMESEGVFAATFERPQILGTLVIRGICDMADEEKADDWQEYAAHAAASFAIAFLKSGPVDPGKT